MRVCCPHPYGTEEYYNWWDLYFAKTIPEVLAQELTREESLKRVNHGHNFGKERRCDCGIIQRDYVDDKTYPKSVCPKKKPIIKSFSSKD